MLYYVSRFKSDAAPGKERALALLELAIERFAQHVLSVPDRADDAQRQRLDTLVAFFNVTVGDLHPLIQNMVRPDDADDWLFEMTADVHTVVDAVGKKFNCSWNEFVRVWLFDGEEEARWKRDTVSPDLKDLTLMCGAVIFEDNIMQTRARGWKSMLIRWTINQTLKRSRSLYEASAQVLPRGFTST
jgi:hypothetical protein